ncbi:hypothetical protein HYX12_02180 [Candidatus Woesearchaeota archaeon]|nr:hypothetical protein [Candidatus Woesearchaeota archaeon]
MMKKIVVLLLICATLLLVGCKEKVDYIDVTKELSCVGLQNPNDWYGTIIHSEQQLQTYAKENNNTFRAPSAEPCPSLPEIDFSKYTLLGMQLTGSGCDDETYFEVNKNEKTVLVEGRLIGCPRSDFSDLVLSMRNMWALIPKISNDYRVSWNSHFSLTEEDLPQVKERLESGNFNTVYSTLSEIEKLGEVALPLVPTLVEIFDDYDYPQNQRIAEIAIDLDSSSADSLYPKLINILKTGDVDDKLNVAIPLIIKMGRGKEITNYIVEITKIYPDGNAAFQYLADMGDDGLPTLYELSESDVPSIRLLAAEHIVNYYPITKGHVPYLTIVFENGKQNSRRLPFQTAIKKIKQLDPETRQEIDDFIKEYGRTWDLTPSTD